jgi:anti-sigma factor ChrR (cupin superfamily)
MQERSVNVSTLPWDDAKDYPAGLRRKILRTGPDGKPRVALIRLEAGFQMAAHSHDLAENHYVLEGMYESLGKEYASGSYRYIPRHASHGPVRSNAGALILVTWES